jgi:hypothetical protein
VASFLLAAMSAVLWARNWRDRRDQLILPLGFERYIVLTSDNNYGSVLLLHSPALGARFQWISEPPSFIDRGIFIVGAGDWKYMNRRTALLGSGHEPQMYYYAPNGTFPGFQRYAGTTYAWIGFRHWLAVLVFGTLPWPWMIVAWYRRRWTNRRLLAGLCVHCGYDLRGTPDCCPECGEAAATTTN